MSDEKKSGRSFRPTTQTDPLLHFLFTEQERRQMPNYELAKLAGVATTLVHVYRHPSPKGGKKPFLAHTRWFAGALGYHFPDRLALVGSDPEREALLQIRKLVSKALQYRKRDMPADTQALLQGIESLVTGALL